VIGSRRDAWPTAVAADALVVLVFAVVGRASHDEPVTVVGVLHVAWPFLLAAGIGLGSAALTHDDPRSLKVGVRVWLVTVVLGMVLRHLTGGGTAAAFVVVATVVLGPLFLGWRLVARVRRWRHPLRR
jgi:hypothetical protein